MLINIVCIESSNQIGPGKLLSLINQNSINLLILIGRDVSQFKEIRIMI